MFKTLIPIFIGLILGLHLGYKVHTYITFYKFNCNNTKYSYGWISEKEFMKHGMHCLDSSQTIDEELNGAILWQLFRNEIGWYEND